MDNAYTWGSGFECRNPDGTMYKDFLPKLNKATCSYDDIDDVEAGCKAPGGHADWRVPTVWEATTIRIDEPPLCDTPPCIDPMLQPTGIGTWTSMTVTEIPWGAWSVHFIVSEDPIVGGGNKHDPVPVRAVRGGR